MKLLSAAAFVLTIDNNYAFTWNNPIPPTSALTSQSTIPSPSSLNPSYATTTTSLYGVLSRSTKTKKNNNRKWKKNKNYYDQDERTEPMRLRFQLNQIKGQLVESEMRATAAERRVAILNKTIQEMDSQTAQTQDTTATVSGDANGIKTKTTPSNDETDERLQTALKKSRSLLQSIQTKSEEQIKQLEESHQTQQSKWDKQRQSLQGELQRAKSQYQQAKDDQTQIQSKLDRVTKEMRIEIQQLKKEAADDLEKLQTEFTKEKALLEEEAREEQLVLLQDCEVLEQELVDTKERCDALMEELESTREELKAELVSVRSKAAVEIMDLRNTMNDKLKKQDFEAEEERRRILEETGREINWRDGRIAELELERKSVRKMMRISVKLLKGRLQNLFQRMSKLRSK